MPNSVSTFGGSVDGDFRRRAKSATATKDVDGEAEVLAKIAAMPEPDRTLARQIHAIVTACAPTLVPKIWHNMPAYAKDGDVLCYFKGAHRFKERLTVLGFTDQANLDDGNMWPLTIAVRKLTAADQARIGALIKKAGR